MRFLIVSQYFWPENFRINDLAAQLVARGHEVTVLCGTPNYPGGRIFAGFGWFRRTRERWNGVEVVRTPVIARGRSSRLRLAANYLSYALSASVLGPLRCRGRYDAILTFQMSPVTMGVAAAVMKLFKRAPVLFWVQDLWPESLIAAGAVRSRWLLWPIDRLVSWLYRASACVLIQSRAFRAHVESRGVGAHRVHYFPNSAESIYVPLEAGAAHPALAAVPHGLRVMFAGNLGSVQDLPTVLDAAERTRSFADVQWLLVGDGSMRPWLQAEIARRGLGATVHLLGQFPVQEMPRLFAGADALLVTLRRDPILALTIPSKVQSYLASAKPIIAALDGEGAAVVSESGAGLCAAPEDPAALAARVLELRALDPARRAEMGQRGRAYYLAHFERDMLIARFEAWSAELAGPRAARRANSA
jgi:colanic acid biosynthesis glycosyl transferase WcaI